MVSTAGVCLGGSELRAICRESCRPISIGGSDALHVLYEKLHWVISYYETRWLFLDVFSSY